MKKIYKFLGVILDGGITWKDHIRTVESKIAKNIGLLYRDKQLLNTSSLKSIYFSCIQKSFTELIKKPNHNYPTKISKNQLYLKIILSKQYEIFYFDSRIKVME